MQILTLCVKLASVEQTMKTQSGASDLFGIPLALSDQLNMSNKKVEELEKVTQKERDEYYAAVKKLRKKAMDNILKKLSKEDREKMDDLIGDFFDEHESQRSFQQNLAKTMKKSREAAKKRKKFFEKLRDKKKDREVQKEKDDFW